MYNQGEGSSLVVCHPKGLQIQCVSKIIENSILSYYRGGYKGLIPHPALISRLSILGSVQGDWDEPNPRALPLLNIVMGKIINL